MLVIKRLTACLAALIAAGCVLFSCKNDQPRELYFNGQTMGTTYLVMFAPQKGLTLEAVKATVERELVAVNQSMSVFDPQSEISRFNALSAAETQSRPFKASAAFYNVMLEAQNIYALTGGAWDGTIKPLVDLWGFGAYESAQWPPGAEAVTTALQNTGFNKITFGPGQTLIKEADVTVDLSSIAKGYGVDAVARALSALGLENFLVEIGGEVYAQGVKVGDKPWRVGISRPTGEVLQNNVYKATALKDMAMATSGNYRNFRTFNAPDNGEPVTVSHIIDPRTGYPVKSAVVSVSVIAPSCAVADGLATAMYVMGLEQSLALAEAHPDIEVFIIEERPGQRLVNHMSSGMGLYLIEN